jgi:hypothetical protein
MLPGEIYSIVVEYQTLSTSEIHGNKYVEGVRIIQLSMTSDIFFFKKFGHWNFKRRFSDFEAELESFHLCMRETF